MKLKRAWLLGLLVLGTAYGASAQNDDRYLDDAYLSKRDIEKIRQRERHEAELRRQAELEERKAWEAKQAKLRAEYLRKRKDRELDAYNGRLSNEMDDEEIYSNLERRRPSEERGKTEINVYGPYSERLMRFHTDGTVVINDPDAVYINGDRYYDRSWRGGSSFSISFGGGWGFYDSWYPWYSGYPGYGWGYYDPWLESQWRYNRYWRGYGWMHYPYRPWGLWGGIYDPWFDPWYSSYYRGYYHGYYGRDRGHYRGYYGGFDAGYYDGAANRAYNDHYYRNPYSHGNRSRSSNYYEQRTAYGAYRNAHQDDLDRGRRYDYNTSRNGYRNGGTTSTYDRGNSSSRSRSDYDYSRSRNSESSRSYSSPSRSNNSSNSSGGGSSSPSRSNGGGSSGGGGGMFDRPTRR